MASNAEKVSIWWRRHVIEAVLEHHSKQSMVLSGFCLRMEASLQVVPFTNMV